MFFICLVVTNTILHMGGYKGTCSRGDACPYRHEMPVKNELSEQNIKDRFYGINDPVARKMLSKYEENGNRTVTNRPPPPAPQDITIRTLFLGGIEPDISEDHISTHFRQFGPLTNVSILSSKKCAFVSFVQFGVFLAFFKFFLFIYLFIFYFYFHFCFCLMSLLVVVRCVGNE